MMLPGTLNVAYKRCHALCQLEGKYSKHGADAAQRANQLRGVQRRVERLESWLGNLGHKKCNLHIRELPDGVGTVAGKGGVKKNDVIVHVPKEAFMTSETALHSAAVGDLIRRGKLNSWQALCLHLLHEQAKGEDSFWHPYISILSSPKTMVRTHPLMWSEAQAEWLKGSPMLTTLNRRQLQCREDADAMIEAGANEILPRGSTADPLVSLQRVRWAAATILSRAFSLRLQAQQLWSLEEEDSGLDLALVPWADMLNHSSSASSVSCLSFDPSTGAASLRAHRSYKEEDEVFDSYGPGLSPSQLLLDYGFVDEDNRNHFVTLPAATIGPLRARENAELLGAAGLPQESSQLQMSEDGVDTSVLAWARAALASPSLLSANGWNGEGDSWQARATLTRLSSPVSSELEAEVLERLIGVCQDQLRNHPSSDLSGLVSTQDDSANTFGIETSLKRSIVKALFSERRALLGAQRHLLIQLSKISN